MLLGGHTEHFPPSTVSLGVYLPRSRLERVVVYGTMWLAWHMHVLPGAYHLHRAPALEEVRQESHPRVSYRYESCISKGHRCLLFVRIPRDGCFFGAFVLLDYCLCPAQQIPCHSWACECLRFPIERPGAECVVSTRNGVGRATELSRDLRHPLDKSRHNRHQHIHYVVSEHPCAEGYIPSADWSSNSMDDPRHHGP